MAPWRTASTIIALRRGTQRLVSGDGKSATFLICAKTPSFVDFRGVTLSLIQQHRPVRHGIVQLLQRGMTMLCPLVRMPPAHGRDPLSLRYVLPARGERLLDFTGRPRVLQDRVISGPVGQADDVHVRLDEAGDDGAAVEVDDAGARTSCGRRVADSGKAAVPNRHRPRDGVAPVHRVYPAVDKDDVRFVYGRRGRLRGDLRAGRSTDRDAGRCADRTSGAAEKPTTRETAPGQLLLLVRRKPDLNIRSRRAGLHCTTRNSTRWRAPSAVSSIA